MLKMKYEILYKNGHEDVIEQDVTNETIEAIHAIDEMIKSNMKDEAHGYFSLGDGKTEGYTIRMADVTRVKITPIK